ncbi:MAG: Hpt domain-containing protein, partial [Symploca sp. SIO2B6]|nr:Hpt domain-containing protein [Symploca sp. SIO2B6]
KAAHTLRSSSANLGLERLSYLCETLEKYGRGYISIAPRDYKTHLQSEYKVAREELITVKDNYQEIQ